MPTYSLAIGGLPPVEVAVKSTSLGLESGTFTGSGGPAPSSHHFGACGKRVRSSMLSGRVSLNGTAHCWPQFRRAIVGRMRAKRDGPIVRCVRSGDSHRAHRADPHSGVEQYETKEEEVFIMSDFETADPSYEPL